MRPGRRRARRRQRGNRHQQRRVDLGVEVVMAGVDDPATERRDPRPVLDQIAE